MADVTYSVLQSTSVNEIWRQIQGKLFDAISYSAEEFSWMEEMKDARLEPSTRSVIYPLNMYLTGGVASIAEGASEAVPSTAPAEEASCSLVQLNKRFTVSILVQLIDQFAGANATQVESQFKYSARHMLLAMSNRMADLWYGHSDGVIAQTNSNLNATTNLITLTNGYGETWITDPSFIARKIQAGTSAELGADRVAFYDSGTRVANAVGFVVAKTESTGVIKVQFDSSAPGISTDGLSIVFANSVDNTADDYNRGFTGLLDGLITASVNGLSNATVPQWSVAYSDTSGGTFNGQRIQRGVDAISDFGPMPADSILISKGVYRNVMGQYATQLRFTDVLALPVDGDVKRKGTPFKKTKRVPPGMAVAYASGCWQRFFGQPELEGQTRGLSYGDLKKMENKSGLLASANYVGNLPWRARKGFSYWTGLTES